MFVNSESVVVVSTTEIETGVSYKSFSKIEPTEGFWCSSVNSQSIDIDNGRIRFCLNCCVCLLFAIHSLEIYFSFFAQFENKLI